MNGFYEKEVNYNIVLQLKDIGSNIIPTKPYIPVPIWLLRNLTARFIRLPQASDTEPF